MLTVKGSFSFVYLPFDAGGLTHHKPNSFPIQRPYLSPHHVLHKYCLSEDNIQKIQTSTNRDIKKNAKNEEKVYILQIS